MADFNANDVLSDLRKSQGPLGTHVRTPSTQGTGEDPQSIDGGGAETTGMLGQLGILAGSVLTATGKGPKGAIRQEAIPAALGAAGEVAETMINQKLQGRPLSVGVEDLLRAGETAALSAGGGFAVRGIQKAGRSTLDKIPFFKNSVTPEGRDLIRQTDDIAKELGVTSARPSQITQSSILDVLDNISANSLGGAGKVSAHQYQSEKILNAVGDAVVNSVSPRTRPDKLGKMFLDTVNDNGKLAEALNGVKWEETRAMAKGLWADIGNITGVAKKHLEDITRRGDIVPRLTGSTIAKKASGLGKSGEVDPVLGGALKAVGESDNPHAAATVFAPLLKAIEGKSNRLALDDLIESRKLWGKLAASYKKNPELKNSPAARVIADLIEQADDSITRSMKQSGADPVLLKTYNEAKEGFKADVVSKFRTKTLGRVMKKVATEEGGAPEVLGNALAIAAKDGGLTQIRAAQNAIGAFTPEWRRVTRGVIDHIKMESTRDGKLIGSQLLENLVGVNGIGKDALVTMAGKQYTTKLLKFAKALDTLQKKNPISTGSMGIQLQQWGLMVGQAAGALTLSATGNQAEAGLVLLGPAVLTRLMHSRRGLEVLTKAIQTDPRSREWPRAAGRLIAEATVSRAMEDAHQITEGGKVSSSGKKSTNIDKLLEDFSQ